jgi:hypothetical protein
VQSITYKSHDIMGELWVVFGFQSFRLAKLVSMDMGALHEATSSSPSRVCNSFETASRQVRNTTHGIKRSISTQQALASILYCLWRIFSIAVGVHTARGVSASRVSVGVHALIRHSGEQ